MTEATLSFVMGIVYTVLTCGLLFWLTWFFSHWWMSWRGNGPTNAGLIAVGVYLLVGTFSAWRNVDPFATIDFDPNYSGDRLGGLSMMTGLPIVDRHGIAAAGAALIAGPLNILEGIADIRRRLPTDHTTLDATATMLQQAVRNLKLTSELNGKAIMLLHRLALIKVRSEAGHPVIMLTLKGMDVVSAP